MESITEVVLLESEELTLGGRIPSGELISSEELIFSEDKNNFGNVPNAALVRRFSLRVSSGTSEGEGHVS